jgi:hypothetical protein
MPWTRRKNPDGSWVWRCTKYSDLNYAEINNFAEYGSPVSPYEAGFDQKFDPDFAHVTIEMPQSEVMNHGFGMAIDARSFPIVRRFLSEALPIPFGTFHFDDLVRSGLAKRQDRVLLTNLYTSSARGDINPADAAYIYGTVGFAIMRSSTFSYSANLREVNLEIGALDDNWDFESGTLVAKMLNPLVAATFGPDHYNLEAPIRIRFIGPGRMFREREAVRAGPWWRTLF